MMKTIVTTLKNVALTTDTGPRPSYDPMIIPGVLLRHDYRNPHTVAQTGAIVQGTPISDLAVYGAQRAGSAVINSGTIVREAGGLRFSQPSGYSRQDYINAGQNPLTSVTHDLLVIAWVRNGTVDYDGVLGVGNAFNDNGADNVFHTILMSGSSFAQVHDQGRAGRGIGLGPALSRTAWTQIAYSVQFGGAGAVLRGYQSGALVTEQTVAGMTALASSALPLTVGASGPGNQSDAATLIVHVEDLTASGQAPLARVQRDYALVGAVPAASL